jgi:ferric-dicitrate binding protein FerR (iron transport regulator)
MVNSKYSISRIIAGFFTKSNTKQEDELLKEWLNESDDNLKIFAGISDYERYEKWETIYSRFEKEADWQGIRHKIEKEKGRKIRLGVWLARAAAIIVIPLILFFFINRDKSVVQNNTMIIPKGADYQMTLSDGTRVWLNADTKFSYPATFYGKTREVGLEGEAFFEVTPDKKRPFVVKTGDMSVVVVGTEFNIRAYGNDQIFQVTLNKGKVKVLSPYEEVLLTPDQQASLTPDKKIIVDRDIDASIYSAWKNGMFRFKDQQLKTITEDLERWYKVRILFDSPELADIRFSINVERYNSIADLFELIKETGKIDYEITKDLILVKEKDKIK